MRMHVTFDVDTDVLAEALGRAASPCAEFGRVMGAAIVARTLPARETGALATYGVEMTALSADLSEADRRRLRSEPDLFDVRVVTRPADGGEGGGGAAHGS